MLANRAYFDIDNEVDRLYIQQKSFKYMRIAETPKITVAIRKRPLNKKELQRSETDIVRVGQNGQVTISEYKQKVDLTKYLEETTFNFDFAYDENSSNEQIYDQSIRPLIQNAFMGAKISCFAYGQTGSGKTHTMKGDISKGVPGLYYLGARQIFHYIEQPQFRHLHVTVSFYQIYCGRLHDLLNNRQELKIREDKNQNINVIGMEEKLICSAQEFLEVIEYGSNFRVTSQNATNADSSRSHAILQITLKNDKKTFTKISFIDLAGNQRGADHIDQNKQTKIDGAEINKSLLSLKQCIRALDQAKSHTPFRGSKLTMVLKDSFVGFCNTVMICNVSPNVTSSENTMNTLRYADRVKQLKRSDQSEGLSKEEMRSIELMLPRANNKNCIKVNIESTDDNEDIMMKMEQARQLQNRNKMDIEQKMDIEPAQNKKPIFSQFGRKTDNLTNEIKLYNFAEKKMNGKSTKDIQRSTKTSMDNQSSNYKGKQIIFENEKLPLLSKNNNLNSVNIQMPEYEKRRPEYPNNIVDVNKKHFEMMRNLRVGFELHREDHESLIKQEMAILMEEMKLKEELRRKESTGVYEEEIQDVNNYLDRMEQFIMEKDQLITTMKKNIQKMRYNARQAEELTHKMRYQQQNTQSYQRPANNMFFNQNPVNLNQNPNGCRSQTRLHLHSSMNGINFNGFNNYNQYGDQQLLEGLPGDESMTRLF